VNGGETVVIDSSVIIAIFKDEAEAADLLDRAMAYDRRVLSSAIWLESAIVCEGKAERGGGAAFDRIVSQLKLEILPFSATQAVLARDAFKRFGKGRGSKASLSFGDCFAYALAMDLGAPLLFKGDDFVHTDVDRA
jgi:ribonuclease VapC